MPFCATAAEKQVLYLSRCNFEDGPSPKQHRALPPRSRSNFDEPRLKRQTGGSQDPSLTSGAPRIRTRLGHLRSPVHGSGLRVTDAPIARPWFRQKPGSRPVFSRSRTSPNLAAAAAHGPAPVQATWQIRSHKGPRRAVRNFTSPKCAFVLSRARDGFSGSAPSWVRLRSHLRGRFQATKGPDGPGGLAS